MSNVLIGIIGVILFIGLALAGALFLGVRFSDSRNTSVAASVVQAVSQVSNAANLASVEDARSVQAGLDPEILKVRGYLKNVPINPSGTEGIRLVSKDGSLTGDASLSIARLSPGSEQVCAAIVRQTANGSDIVGTDGVPVVSSASGLPLGPVGCFRASAAINSFASGALYGFARQ
jgi:hypothetical protein